MNDLKQPEVLRLAKTLESLGLDGSADLVRMQHYRIVELEAQLEAIGAGVETLRKSAPAAVAVPKGYDCGIQTDNRVTLYFETQDAANLWFEAFCDAYDAENGTCSIALPLPLAAPQAPAVPEIAANAPDLLPPMGIRTECEVLVAEAVRRGEEICRLEAENASLRDECEVLIGEAVRRGEEIASLRESAALRFADRIAQRAAEAERQACEAACAEIAHQNRKAQMLMPRQGLIAEQTAMECEAAIRARGINKEQA